MDDGWLSEPAGIDPRYDGRHVFHVDSLAEPFVEP